MTKHIDSSKLSDEDGMADNVAWEEYCQVLAGNPKAEDLRKFRYSVDGAGMPRFTPVADAPPAAHVPEREMRPLFDYMFRYFPDAYLAEVAVAWEGNKQHNPGQKMYWARGKSTDHPNKAFRHIFDHARGTKKDTDGTWHLAKAIWRLKAWLQEEIEAEQKQQKEDDKWHSAN